MQKIWTMGELLAEIMRPEVDIPLSRTGPFMGPYPSGAPGIFIDTAARLGCPAGIISAVADDDFGKLILNRLTSDGVDCRYVLNKKDSYTAAAFVMYETSGDRNFIFHIENTPAVMAKSVEPEDSEEPGFFHIMGCSLTANRDFSYEIIKTMHAFVKKGARVSFDPNIRKEMLCGTDLDDLIKPVMENCSVFMPGHDELLLISGCDSIQSAVDLMFSRYGNMEIIVIKNGKKGCRIITRDKDLSFGIYDIEPLDPTGAGDSFDAGFLCGLLSGYSLLEAAKQATAAASLNTGAFGPMEGAINPETVSAMIEENKVLNL